MEPPDLDRKSLMQLAWQIGKGEQEKLVHDLTRSKIEYLFSQAVVGQDLNKLPKAKVIDLFDSALKRAKKKGGPLKSPR